ncbi:DUF2993 domain-containing protein [Corynebacterium sp.]|uniref:LmeA family phospholipid-binding protein n=1 Tax=Corynebacterium sp. TaxID=1720 RepID=UPI0026DAE338|nr:DUF2993 domain-containing protein [Corynebacterium sp.]MDO5031915.1 DUF2993 domain-containing protein [Corynebacterium sp.]
MASQKTAAKTAWKIFVGVLVALLLLILLAEFGLRWFMGQQMKDQFAQAAKEEGIEVTEDPSVSFGATPLIFGMLGGSIPYMEMHSPSTLQINGTEIKGQPASDVTMEDVSLSQDNPTAGSMEATTTVPDDFLLATFQRGIAEKSGNQAIGDLVVTAITANDEADTLDVEFAGGLATLSLKPAVNEGQLRINAQSASLLGFDLPEQVTATISDALESGMSDQLLGQGMKVENVDVRAGELAMTISAENLPLNQMSALGQ